MELGDGQVHGLRHIGYKHRGAPVAGQPWAPDWVSYGERMVKSGVRAGRRAGWVLALAGGMWLMASGLAAQESQEIACAPHPGSSPTEAWQIVPLPQSSLVFARDGSLIGEIGTDWRTSISLATLPKYVPEAFIAVEDKRFYEHDGVDLVGIAGALKDAVTGDVRGASTITQLLVGNMHPDLIDRRDRSISRKLHEQAAAREMEKHYNKAQILEAFLNTINFGHRWCGIEEAARHYFGKRGVATHARRGGLAGCASQVARRTTTPRAIPTATRSGATSSSA